MSSIRTICLGVSLMFERKSSSVALRDAVVVRLLARRRLCCCGEGGELEVRAPSKQDFAQAPHHSVQAAIRKRAAMTYSQMLLKLLFERCSSDFSEIAKETRRRAAVLKGRNGARIIREYLQNVNLPSPSIIAGRHGLWGCWSIYRHHRWQGACESEGALTESRHETGPCRGHMTSARLRTLCNVSCLSSSSAQLRGWC
ncbi:uncharacterized protein EI97DRAFT_185677 [Westerdykella ornata]|uniref:Uncharacterized protein n=1 Tax=Westerdykella ornata TaxID=318751 RepID=A0A6A6JUF5_WESOR|nr:uncharacterized protein EI97DRAFT_185677 [Westerdykella ornata]KAF2279733.1 hypothetical protein EI97DRAFT_185677 [Westerdykella ornata]